MACEDQNESTALMLVRAGADINRQNKEEKTPLSLANTAELRRKMTESAQ
jgi:ankyrin repeat protein